MTRKLLSHKGDGLLLSGGAEQHITCWLRLQRDKDRGGAGLPKGLHLFDRCCIGLLQIKWLSKMLIKTSNNLHFVYSNLHNCTVTQYSALLPCSDFHQLSSIFDVLISINTVETACAMEWKKEMEFRDSCNNMKALTLLFIVIPLPMHKTFQQRFVNSSWFVYSKHRQKRLVCSEVSFHGYWFPHNNQHLETEPPLLSIQINWTQMKKCWDQDHWCLLTSIGSFIPIVAPNFLKHCLLSQPKRYNGMCVCSEQDIIITAIKLLLS